MHQVPQSQQPRQERNGTRRDTAVPLSVNKNTPPNKNTLGSISLKNTKSRAGEQFSLFSCKAKARRKGVFVHRLR